MQTGNFIADILFSETVAKTRREMIACQMQGGLNAGLTDP